MRILKLKLFGRFQRREGIEDRTLVEAVRRADLGLIDASLGGELVKLRVARQGQGRRGGYRTILAYRRKQLAVFLFGYAKNEMDNIDDATLDELREIGRDIFSMQPDQFEDAVIAGELTEIFDDRR